jgi:uncharacterized lipoprotein
MDPAVAATLWRRQGVRAFEALELVAEARRGDTTHVGTYKSSVEHDLPFTPSAARNQEMVNDILSRSIERMLNDPEMQAFLAGNDNP